MLNQQKEKEDILIFKLSNQLNCEVCKKSFKSIKSIPFKTIKLCNKCIEEKKDELYNYIFEITDENILKVDSCDIKGKEFNSEYLTWKQLKEFLNTVESDVVLNCPVICQEHHHFEYIRCNPLVEIRCDEELKGHLEELKDGIDKFDGNYIRDQFELMLTGNDNYTLKNPKHFNLSLMI